jgi:hypothetical protein
VGLIRKTVSISTLGIVPFRSKKERLRRAEKARDAATEELAAVQAARAAADVRVSAAEKRANQAELLALHEAKAANRRRRRRHEARVEHGRKARKQAMKKARHAAVGVREGVDDLVGAAQPKVEAGLAAAREGRRKAGKVARRGGRRAQRRAGRLADKAKAAIDS